MHVVLITGLERTGSDLTQRLLDGHPDLYVLPMAGFRFSGEGSRVWPDFSVARRDRNFNMVYETPTTPPVVNYLESSRIGKVKYGFDDYHPDFNFDFDEFLKGWRRDLEAAPEWSDEVILSAYVERFFECLKSHPRTTGKGYVLKMPRLGLDYARFFECFPKGKLIITRRNFPARLASLSKLGWGVVRPGILSRPRSPKELARELWRIHMRAREEKLFEKIVEETEGRYPVIICDFEELLSHTEQAMRRVADFLEIPFDEIMLKPTIYGKPWPTNSSFDSRDSRNIGVVDTRPARRDFWTATDKMIIKLLYRYSKPMEWDKFIPRSR